MLKVELKKLNFFRIAINFFKNNICGKNKSRRERSRLFLNAYRKKWIAYEIL